MTVRLLIGVVVSSLVLPATAWAANGRAGAHAVCPAPALRHAHCELSVVTDANGRPDATPAPAGLVPATIRSAYGFPSAPTAGSGWTIALVDAFDDPTAESDLATFSSQFGLPPCTTANGCFAKVDQSGGTSYPAADQGWALEISLDVQWAHAVAPGAKILLVEASSSSLSDLLTAEGYAATHAQYVSNSWGTSEFLFETIFDGYFQQPGVSFFASSGDSGLGAEWPSVSPGVVSVGGTTLHFDGSGNVVDETGWASGGGGCSTMEAAPAAQSSFAGYAQAGCGGMRATPDVSLNADPASGVSIYDSTPYNGATGWFTVGGTSESSPMWAAASADAGAVVNSAYVYGSAITFRDITTGNNGAPCLVGFDLCSGRGSWLYAQTAPPPPPQSALSFATAPQTLTAGQPSNAMQVGLAATQANDVAFTLASSSKNGAFASSPSGPWGPTLTVTIPAGQQSGPAFYYSDTTAGSPTLTASAAGFTSGSQKETVAAAAVAAIVVSPATATVNTGGTKTFTASGTDQYGNAVNLAGAAWTTTAPGTVAPATGASTVFTAGAGAGSGSVTATLGGVSGSASVTVVSVAAMTVTVTTGQLTRTFFTYRMPVTVTAVAAATGTPIAGANVSISVYAGSRCSGTPTSSTTSVTGSNGQAGFAFTTFFATTWCTKATVTATGFSTGTGQTTFVT
jgi:hypothetical protein